MKNKVARLQAIREIIIHSRVKSQDEILKKLHELGFDLTQATLSRDLKQLRIAKVPGNDGSYVYIMPRNREHRQIGCKKNYRRIPNDKYPEDSFPLISQEICPVIKTRPGYAWKSRIRYMIAILLPDSIRNYCRETIRFW